MPNVKTVTLTGGEVAVKFDRNYPYFWVQNLGDSDVYLSTSPCIVPGADEVMLVSPKCGRSSGDVGQTDTLYLSGSGKVEITPQFNAVCPFFKYSGEGGDSGGSVDLSEYAKKEDIPDVSEFVSNPDNLNIMVAKNSTNGLSSSTFTFADHIQINTIFPLLNKLPNGENRQVVEMSIPSASQSKAGVMTADDKTKLDNLPLDLSDYATIEQLNDKQNILTKTELSDGSVDWNTLIGTAIYPITIPQGLTDDFTHGLEGIGGYGTLIVLGDNRHTGCYQIYINDEYKIYLRSYYSDSRGWRNWKRIDAGAGVTLKPGISDPTIDWNTITESGLYTIGHDGKITADSHGPLGVTGWGLLTVINTGLGSANPACIRQVYEAGSGSCYTRNKWQINGEWSPWYKYQCQEYTPAQNEEV